MKLVRDTPFEVGWLAWSLSPPKFSLTVVVKATFALARGGKCVLAPVQALPTGDLFYDDDLQQSVRQESDFAILKKRGECFLAGSCHPPNRAPATTSAVAFSVGSVKKALAVYGDRVWVPKLLGHEPGPAVPFTRMPLRWEKSFGGPGLAANPLGIGIAETETPDGLVRALPNIESPQALVSSPRDRPAPAGAFPIPRTWPVRSKVSGTFDSAWQKTRWPWLPVDFDFAYFNGAPLDQQIDGFWKGDEEISLFQLLADEASYSTRLPGLAARVFVERALPSSKKPDAPVRTSFEEVRMHLDTIAVDADERLVSCVWRGLAEVESDKLRDVVHLLVAHESIYEERKKIGWFEERLKLLLAAEKKEDADLHAEAPPAEPEVDMPVRKPDLEEHEIPELVEAKKKLVALGIDPDRVVSDEELQVPASLGAVREDLRRRLIAANLEVPAELDTIPDVMPETPEPPVPPPDPSAAELSAERRARVIAKMEAKESLANEELSGGNLAGLDLSEADLRGAILTSANLRGTKLDRAKLEGAVLARADAEGASFREVAAKRADFTALSAAGVSFDGADLSDAVLGEARLARATFVGATCRATHFESAALPGASFEDAKLDGADMTGADIEGAKLLRASMKSTCLHRVRAARAVMDQADLTKLRADGAVLREASLQRCKAAGARFVGADLTRAILNGSQLDEANLTAATLRSAKLDECSLVRANCREASFESASMLRSNAFEACFEGAELSHADLRGSNLFGAQLWRARTTAVRLERANVERTHLAGGS